METGNIKKLFFILLLVLSGGLTACTESSDKNSEEEKIIVRQVKTGLAQTKSFNQDMDFTGTVEPSEQNIISSSMQLRIQKIYAEVGDPVKKGQILVQMDPYQLLQTKTQLNNLEKEYRRLEALYRTKIVSEQQMDQVKAELDVLRASHENLEENTRLISPVTGVVTSRNYEDGDIYNMGGGAGILSVMRIDPIQVDIHVPERFFPAVENRMPINMKLDVYPDSVFTGEVYLKHPVIDPATRTFRVETRFPNQDMLIRPGMFSRVNIVFETVESVAVPDLAVQRQRGTDDYYVFCVKDGKAVRREIELGRRADGFYEIISGLSEGEVIITEGHAGLLNGMAVNVID